MNQNFENEFAALFNERQAQRDAAQSELFDLCEQFDNLAFADAQTIELFDGLVARRDVLNAQCQELAGVLEMMSWPS